MIQIVLLVFLGFLMGCQTPPTKIYQSNELNYSEQISKLKRPIQINTETVVLDTRGPLDYGFSHISGSMNVTWDSFKQPGSAFSGQLEDPQRISARLSALGISPKSQVVIVGHGQNGDGEEGRLAWMLMYLGVLNVQTVAIDSLQISRTNLVTQQRKSVDRWQPRLLSGLLASKNEVVTAIQEAAPKYILIDARTEKEFFKKFKVRSSFVLPEVNSINIHWSEFFDKNGRPNLRIVKKLSDIGVLKSQRIIVLSQQGLRSGAVTYALTVMGFRNVSNYATGLQELSSN